ncbi:anthranilate synthase component 1 [Desulfurella multipotens]|uniref:Anthranilate synthase component 1 n=1 Tax=Desulfurella multipotens TaxID=79269 RepID=A0A1G6I8B3_9BACT|nr:anthranilate synthase component I family protein [Desulfurella multipotens]SDC02762.1 anthranilate synthase component 1 [Desulfurella multipotens]
MYPTYSEFVDLSKVYDRIPVYMEIDGDLDTPVSLLRSLLDKENCLLLESANQKKIYSRFSFLAFNVKKFVLDKNGQLEGTRQDLGFIKEFLKKNQSASFEEYGNFSGGFIALLSFEFVNECGILREKLKYLPDVLGVFYFVDKFLVYDNYTNKLYLAKSQIAKEPDAYQKAHQDLLLFKEELLSCEIKNGVSSPKIIRKIPKKDFIEKVNFLKKQIEEGEAIQVVLSDYIEVNGLNPFEFYRNLRKFNPSPYMFFIKDASNYVVGSSPEVHISVRKNIAIIKPIAGTRPIGESLEKTVILEQELLKDEKENAEHLMLLDLARNDLSRVCKPLSVKVKSFRQIEHYSHVMHLVSEVEGQIDDSFDLIDCLTNTFPAGTVSGAPKVRAIELIEETEKQCRGFYAGCVGYIGLSGNMDMAITIRTAFFENDKARFQAGAGIVYDSIAENEYKEVLSKLGAMLQAGGINDSFD